MSERPDDDLPTRLRADLLTARKARDAAATTALRTLLAALENAEAPAFDAADHREGRGELVEHERLELTAADHRRVLGDEIARRKALLAETAGTGVDRVYTGELEAELAVLRRYRA